MDFKNVLLREKSFWKEKSRNSWLSQSDANTKFFHITTLARRKRNRIESLKIGENWITDKAEIKNMVTEFYTNLFSVTNSSNIDLLWDGHCCHFTERQRCILDLNPSFNEIKKVVFDMNPSKAPGPDGIKCILYQKYWELVGVSIFEFVKNAFDEGNFDNKFNDTFVALIPKVDKPESLGQFRPISLCNVSYRILTRFLVDRMRPFLSNLIGPHQSSFLPGRMTTDNIVITQEVIHTLMKTKSKKGGMILKIDLEKAYDKISWDFLKQTLVDFNFSNKWIKLIMHCVSTSNVKVLVNGEPCDNIKPGRGLRQGDPLSPYLFVLCMERLANMINEKVYEGSWKGVKASLNGPNITHLFFADDILLFSETDDVNCDTIMDTMDMFCEMSGQSINYQKSLLFVSPNVPRGRKNALHFRCGIPLTDNLGKYLGVPLIHSKMDKRTFKDVLEKTQNRLSGWKTRLLNLAGRVTLVKHVTSCLPMYQMQSLALPMSVCKSFDKMNRDFI